MWIGAKEKMEVRMLLTVLLCVMSITETLGRSLKDNPKLIDAMKKMLLNKLGLDSPPLVNKRKMPSEAALQWSIRLWQNHTMEERNPVESATTTLIAMKTRGINSFTFDFNQDEFSRKNYKLKSASLTISPSERLSNFKRIKITRSKKHTLLTAVHNFTEPYLQVDIFNDIMRWNRKASNNGLYTIKVNCGLALGEKCINSITSPFIDLVYETIHRTRQRKAIGCKSGKTGCCRKTVRVTIKDLGWDDWFYGPLDFDYHYCVGICTNKKNSFYSEIVGGLSESPSCCVPTQLTGLRALYLSEDTIKDKYLHNMMAVDCACGAEV